MGSFNTSCGISGQTIYENDPVFAVFLLKSSAREDSLVYLDSPQDIYLPLPFSISGTYADYGRIKPNPESTRNLNIFIHFLVEKNVTTRKRFDFEKFSEELWNGELNITTDGEAEPRALTIALFHADIYQELLKFTRNSFYEKDLQHRKQDPDMLDNIYDSIITVAKKIKNESQDRNTLIHTLENSLTGSRYLKYSSPNLVLSAKEEEDYKKFERLSQINNGSSLISCEELLDIYKNEIILELEKTDTSPTLKLYLSNLEKTKMLLFGMGFINKPLIPQMTAGQVFNGVGQTLWQNVLLKKLYDRSLNYMKNNDFSASEVAEFKTQISTPLEEIVLDSQTKNANEFKPIKL